jgi:hypothetical protein
MDTAALLGTHLSDAATILTLGDHTYPAGAKVEFDEYFDPRWGQYKARIKPCVGNHEYMTAGAEPYYQYFGKAAGNPARGYYAYNVNPDCGWRVVVCNSEIAAAAGSAQEQWLRHDLASHRQRAYIVAWHRPRFSSGVHRGNARFADLFQACYDGGVSLILNGHEHDYERLAPCDGRGQPDARGPRTFVVGTGGHSLRAFGAGPLPITEHRLLAWGVLRLTLKPGSYGWEFLDARTGQVSDHGQAQANVRPPNGVAVAAAPTRAAAVSLVAASLPPQPAPPDAPSLVETHYEHHGVSHYVVRRYDGQHVVFLFPSEPPEGMDARAYAAALQEEAERAARELDEEED